MSKDDGVRWKFFLKSSFLTNRKRRPTERVLHVLIVQLRHASEHLGIVLLQGSQPPNSDPLPLASLMEEEKFGELALIPIAASSPIQARGLGVHRWRAKMLDDILLSVLTGTSTIIAGLMRIAEFIEYKNCDTVSKCGCLGE